VARAISVAALAALALGATTARAEDAPAPRTVVTAPARPVTPEGGFGAAYRAVVDSALATMRGLSTVQAFVAQRLAPTAPAPQAATAAPPSPPTEKQGAPRLGPVTFGPVAIERTALSAVEPRTFEAVLLGASVPLPWDVP
jgi:hypothetical protein